jgi:hypothetical protein
VAVEGVPKGSYIWMRLMLHEDQAQTKSSKSFKTWEGMLEVNDYDPLSWRSSAIFVLLRGTVCAHAYLPNGFGYVSAGGPALESWAKARKLPVFWTAGQSP